MTRTIRTLAFAEIGTLLDWAAAEGWNPGLNDAAAFQAADPHGFFGAFVGEVMVAGISAVAYDAHFGFIGLYICHRNWRGQGHGKALWDMAIAYLGTRTIGLDGVPEQQANYARMGFVPAYETVRMSGVLPTQPAGNTTQIVVLEDVRDLDRQCFPARRDGFLRHLLSPPNRGLVRRANGEVDAYAVARPCREGTKIGPMFALSTPAALDILRAQSGLVYIDVPTSQTEWLAALSSLAFTEGFRTRRMYKGTPPSTTMSAILGISSLELG